MSHRRGEKSEDDLVKGHGRKNFFPFNKGREVNQNLMGGGNEIN